MTRCYLRVGNDTLDEAERHEAIADAVASFRVTAEQLRSFGQEITATIHIADSRAEVVEDADYFLELGPRGGVRKSRM